jgi:hypothetical protein
VSAPSEEESQSNNLLWQLTKQPFLVLDAQYQIRIERFQNFLSLFLCHFSLSLFLCFSLSLFLFYMPLLFNLLLSLPCLLSNNLEEDFHINAVSGERRQQGISQILHLIANARHFLAESLIYFSNLNLNITPYLVF